MENGPSIVDLTYYPDGGWNNSYVNVYQRVPEGKSKAYHFPLQPSIEGAGWWWRQGLWTYGTGHFRKRRGAHLCNVFEALHVALADKRLYDWAGNGSTPILWIYVCYIYIYT